MNAMNGSVAYPVQVLREHVTGLEAAISVCLADPDHKPVHKLRTETRRVEALLVLLGLVAGLPEHRKEAAQMLRALSKLRRAAGTVRDLDVHRKMLEDFAASEQSLLGPAAQAETNAAEVTAKRKSSAAKGQKRKPDQEAEAPEKPPTQGDEARENAAVLSQSAVELRKRLGREREKAAADLLDVLKHRQAKTARAAETLLSALDPAKDLALPAADLLRDAEAVLTRDGLLAAGKISDLDEDELHSVRKAAKKARYLAESLPNDTLLAAAAQRFESLQEAGGQWHDALELARAARRYFGKGHELTATYRQERDAKLEAYRAALQASLGIERSGKKRPVRRKSARKPSRAGASSARDRKTRAAAAV